MRGREAVVTHPVARDITVLHDDVQVCHTAWYWPGRVCHVRRRCFDIQVKSLGTDAVLWVVHGQGGIVNRGKA